ncbi:VCBS repeat-containing protein [Nocardia sp. NPDC051030]|uniref:FG-GAP repeat domain-containing protein n=1 Tax=Nocardia sp. NPDC051030 TaxID=3155162 RepID=UPI00341E4B9B
MVSTVALAGSAAVGMSGAGPATAAAPISFAPAQFLDTASGVPFVVKAADFNNDGKPDLATCDILQFGWGGMSIQMNYTEPGSTTTHFGGPFQLSGVPVSLGCDVADFNGDGKPDVVAADASKLADGGVNIMLNHTEDGAAQPEFGQPQKFAGGLMPIWTLTADFNGDGKPDLAVGNTLNVGVNAIDIYLNNTPAGAQEVSFTGPFFFNGGMCVEGMAAGDINGDGAVDLVVGETVSSTVTVLMNRTSKGSMVADFQSSETVFPLATWVTLHDMNGDDRPDLLTNIGFFGTPLNGLWTSVNNTAAGSMTPNFQGLLDGAKGQPAGGWATEGTAIADYDGDGKPDAAIASPYINPRNPVTVLRNTTADGAQSLTFDAPVIAGDAGWAPNGIDTADFNGDGKPDIVTSQFLSLTGGQGLAVLINTTR